MEGFVLFSEGKVPSKMAEQYGRELTLKERIKFQTFGLGFFTPIEKESNIFTTIRKLKISEKPLSLSWDIELFFKAIKQTLQIKTFVGTSENAVKSQIFVALICYLLLELIKKTIAKQAELIPKPDLFS